MGIGGVMKESMKENMEKQMAFQKELILKQRQMQMATQVAMGRERFWYYHWFVVTAATAMTLGFLKTKDPKVFAPLLPLSFAYAYQRDMLYEEMFDRVQGSVDELIV